MPVQIATEDSRTIRVPIPANEEDTARAAAYIMNSARDGYVLTKAVTLSGGNQRDPYTIAVKLTFERK